MILSIIFKEVKCQAQGFFSWGRRLHVDFLVILLAVYANLLSPLCVLYFRNIFIKFKIKICISVSLGNQKDVNSQCMSLTHVIKSSEYHPLLIVEIGI